MLDNCLAAIQKKLKRLCYELLIALDCDAPDLAALKALYLRILSIYDELVESPGSTVPVGMENVFMNFCRVFDQVLHSLALPSQKGNEKPPRRIIDHPIYACLCSFSQMMVCLRAEAETSVSPRICSSVKPLSHEPSGEKLLEDAASEEAEAEEIVEPEEIKNEIDLKREFAQLIDLLGELRMSRNVFQYLSRQALLEHNLPTFSKKIKSKGLQFQHVLERVEENVLGLCQRYPDLVIQKQKVLPIKVGRQAFIIGVNQVLEVIKVSRKDLFKRRGHFFSHFRGETLGVIFLSDFYGSTTIQKMEVRGIVVISNGNTKLGLAVEHWSKEQEVHVKPLLDIFVGNREIAGAAVLENGQISLMLDGLALIKRATLEQE
ncbi:chemotaxis protein CheW [Desulfosporosinus hippei]|uniref:histidine kinase n=1 Tax=Desulfosporosinus hippei DSM 8344 TaxID=1121419 RepID=A0A1G7WCF9_9FIRM|nr:chemotaxis protein CheW [Desulfosporosinus hippei]SDG69611.1 CheW-like domain-containing protein [Desulfosporosinus hippei DSM 8344]